MIDNNLYIREVYFLDGRKTVDGVNRTKLNPSVHSNLFICLLYPEDASGNEEALIEEFKFRFSNYATHYHNMGPANLLYQGENIKKAVYALHKMKQITDERFCVLCDLANQYEYGLKYKEKMQNNFSFSQVEIFDSMVDLQLNDLINNIASLSDAIKLISYILYNGYKYDWNLNLKYTSEEISDIKYLRKIIHGRGNLESTYERLYSSVPSLDAHAKLFVQKSLKLIWLKFPETKIIDKFFSELELRAYVCRRDYSHPEDTKVNIIELAQKNPACRRAPFKFNGFTDLIRDFISNYSDVELEELHPNLQFLNMQCFIKIMDNACLRYKKHEPV